MPCYPTREGAVLSAGRQQAGHGLIQLVTTLSIVSILLTIAAPTFRTIRQHQTTNASARSLFVNLAYARQEAITRACQITLCPSTDGVTCTPDSGLWEQGWILFVDDNRDFRHEPAETLLRVTPPLNSGITLRTSSNYRDGIAYLPLGDSRGEGGLANGTFRICCGAHPEDGVAVVLNIEGRPRISREVAQCP